MPCYVIGTKDKGVHEVYANNITELETKLKYPGRIENIGGRSYRRPPIFTPTAIHVKGPNNTLRKVR